MTLQSFATRSLYSLYRVSTKSLQSLCRVSAESLQSLCRVSLLGRRWSDWAEILRVILYFSTLSNMNFSDDFFSEERLPLNQLGLQSQISHCRTTSQDIASKTKPTTEWFSKHRMKRWAVTHWLQRKLAQSWQDASAFPWSLQDVQTGSDSPSAAFTSTKADITWSSISDSTPFPTGRRLSCWQAKTENR
jgi:hypothetical protein